MPDIKLNIQGVNYTVPWTKDTPPSSTDISSIVSALVSNPAHSDYANEAYQKYRQATFKPGDDGLEAGVNSVRANYLTDDALNNMSNDVAETAMRLSMMPWHDRSTDPQLSKFTSAPARVAVLRRAEEIAAQKSALTNGTMSAQRSSATGYPQLQPSPSGDISIPQQQPGLLSRASGAFSSVVGRPAAYARAIGHDVLSGIADKLSGNEPNPDQMAPGDAEFYRRYQNANLAGRADIYQNEIGGAAPFLPSQRASAQAAYDRLPMAGQAVLAAGKMAADMATDPVMYALPLAGSILGKAAKATAALGDANAGNAAGAALDRVSEILGAKATENLVHQVTGGIFTAQMAQGAANPEEWAKDPVGTALNTAMAGLGVLGVIHGANEMRYNRDLNRYADTGDMAERSARRIKAGTKQFNDPRAAAKVQANPFIQPQYSGAEGLYRLGGELRSKDVATPQGAVPDDPAKILADPKAYLDSIAAKSAAEDQAAQQQAPAPASGEGTPIVLDERHGIPSEIGSLDFPSGAHFLDSTGGILTAVSMDENGNIRGTYQKPGEKPRPVVVSAENFKTKLESGKITHYDDSQGPSSRYDAAQLVSPSKANIGDVYRDPNTNQTYTVEGYDHNLNIRARTRGMGAEETTETLSHSRFAQLVPVEASSSTHRDLVGKPGVAFAPEEVTRYVQDIPVVGRYVIGPVGDFAASHDEYQNVNPQFTGVQPRPRGADYFKAQIQKIINNFRPEEIYGHNPQLVSGAGVVDEVGNQISGNGRQIAEVARAKKMSPEQIADHNNIVAAFAAQHGIDREHINTVVDYANSQGQPLTVKFMRNPDKAVETDARIADLSNKSPAAARTSAEVASSDVDALMRTQAIDSKRKPGGDTKTTRENDVRDFIRAIDDPSQHPELFNKDGGLTSEAHSRYNAAVTAYAYGSKFVTDVTQDRSAEGVHRIGAALDEAAPQVAEMRSNGNGWVGDVVGAAIKKLTQDLSQGGSFMDRKQALSMFDLDGPVEHSEHEVRVEAVADFMHGQGNRGAGIEAMIDHIYGLLKQREGLFADTELSDNAILREAINYAEERFKPDHSIRERALKDSPRQAQAIIDYRKGVLDRLGGYVPPAEAEAPKQASFRLGAETAPKIESAGRGREAVQATIDRAVAAGVVDPRTAHIAEWLLQQSPEIADGLALEIGGGDGGVAGFFDAITRTVEMFGPNGDPNVLAHEFLHAAERFMPEDIRRAIQQEWKTRFDKAVAEAESRGDNARVAALNDLAAFNSGDAEVRGRVIQAIKDGVLTEEDYSLADPSEHWAVNAARIVAGRAEAGTWTAKAVQWIKEFIQHIRAVFGMDSDHAVIKALDAILDPKTDKTTDRGLLNDGEGQFAISENEKRAVVALVGQRMREFGGDEERAMEMVRKDYPQYNAFLDAMKEPKTPEEEAMRRRLFMGDTFSDFGSGHVNLLRNGPNRKTYALSGSLGRLMDALGAHREAANIRVWTHSENMRMMNGEAIPADVIHEAFRLLVGRRLWEEDNRNGSFQMHPQAVGPSEWNRAHADPRIAHVTDYWANNVKPELQALRQYCGLTAEQIAGGDYEHFISLVVKNDVAGKPVYAVAGKSIDGKTTYITNLSLGDIPITGIEPISRLTDARKSKFSKERVAGEDTRYETDPNVLLSAFYYDVIKKQRYAALIQDGIAEGILHPFDSIADMPKAIEVNGKLHRVTQLDLSRFDNVDWIPGMTEKRSLAVPEGFAHNLYQILEATRLGDHAAALQTYNSLMTALSLTLNPAELTGHMRRQLGTVSAIPPVNAGVLSRYAWVVPWLGPRLDAAIRMYNIDMHDPYIQQIVTEIFDSGGGTMRPFQHETNQIAAMLGADREGGRGAFGRFVQGYQSWVHDLLFGIPDAKGIKGWDVRVRVVAELARRAAEPELANDPKRMREFANQFGQYASNPEAMIKTLRFINPFTGTSIPMRITELRHLFGGHGFEGVGLANDIKYRTETLMRGTIGTMLAFSVVCKQISGKWPWESKPGHLLDLPVGKDKDGKMIYLDGGALAPEFKRAVTALGLRMIDKDRGLPLQKQDYVADVLAGAANDMLTTIDGPWVNAGTVALWGDALFLTKQRGKAPEFVDVAGRVHGEKRSKLQLTAAAGNMIPLAKTVGSALVTDDFAQSHPSWARFLGHTSHEKGIQDSKARAAQIITNLVLGGHAVNKPPH